MFDRSAIMTRAWVFFRWNNGRYESWQKERSEDIRRSCTFSTALRMAWSEAKDARRAAELRRIREHPANDRERGASALMETIELLPLMYDGNYQRQEALLKTQLAALLAA